MACAALLAVAWRLGLYPPYTKDAPTTSIGPASSRQKRDVHHRPIELAAPNAARSVDHSWPRRARASPTSTPSTAVDNHRQPPPKRRQNMRGKDVPETQVAVHVFASSSLRRTQASTRRKQANKVTTRIMPQMGSPSTRDTRPPRPRHPGSVGARHGAVQWRSWWWGDTGWWTGLGWPQVAPAWIHSRQEPRRKTASSQPQLLCLPLRPFSWGHTSHFPPPPPHTTFSRVWSLDLMALVHHPRPITAAKKASRTPPLPPLIFFPHSNQSPSTSKPVFVGAPSHHPIRLPKSPHTHTGSPYRVLDAGLVWRRARDAGQVRLEGWKEG